MSPAVSSIPDLNESLIWEYIPVLHNAIETFRGNFKGLFGQDLVLLFVSNGRHDYDGTASPTHRKILKKGHYKNTGLDRCQLPYSSREAREYRDGFLALRLDGSSMNAAKTAKLIFLATYLKREMGVDACVRRIGRDDYLFVRPTPEIGEKLAPENFTKHVRREDLTRETRAAYYEVLMQVDRLVADEILKKTDFKTSDSAELEAENALESARRKGGLVRIIVREGLALEANALGLHDDPRVSSLLRALDRDKNFIGPRRLIL